MVLESISDIYLKLMAGENNNDKIVTFVSEIISLPRAVSTLGRLMTAPKEVRHSVEPGVESLLTAKGVPGMGWMMRPITEVTKEEIALAMNKLKNESPDRNDEDENAK